MSANKGSPKPQRIADDPDSNHWEAVSISFVTLATLVLVGLFTLVGLSEEVLASPRLRGRVLVTGVLAMAAYLLCLWFAYRSIFSESSERKKSGAKETAALFIAEAMAVAATAVLVVWARLDEEMPDNNMDTE